MVRRVDRKRRSHWSGVPDIGLGRKGVKKDEEAGKMRFGLFKYYQ